MAIADSKKVDYLWKKIGYGATKTDTNAAKKAPNEAIASPLFLRGENVWVEGGSVPGVLPGSSTSIVTVYPTSNPIECTVDATATANRTWKTGQINWIPPEMGSTYQVKVYIHTASDAAGASGGTQVFATGSGNDDEWFFDYQSGVLHFIGTNLPNGVDFTGKSVYISGGRYVGVLGVKNYVDSQVSGGVSSISMNGLTDVDAQPGDKQDGDVLIVNNDSSDTFTLASQLNTGLRLPSGTTADRPTAYQGIIRLNTDTGVFEGSTDGSTWQSLRTTGTADISKEQFLGDGSTTQFVLSTTPQDENNIIVYMDGVMQEPDQNYTLSGTILSFTGGDVPHSGARIVVMLGFDTV